MALKKFLVTILTKQDAPFNVIPNAEVTIRERNSNGSTGGLATIFSDSAGTNPITNPGARTNQNGQLEFFARVNNYVATYTEDGQLTSTDIGVDLDSTKQWQERLYPRWISNVGDGTGNPFSYSRGMVVYHNNQNWTSSINNNQTEPMAGASWSIFTAPLSEADADSRYTVTESDVVNMIANTSGASLLALATAGGRVETKVHNTFTNKGGHVYKVVTTANYTRNLLGSLTNGRWLGADYADSTGDYVFQRVDDITAEDASFGVIGTADTSLGVIDDHPALAAFIAYCRIGTALGGKRTGGTIPIFTPRSLWWMSDTLNLIDFRSNLDFGNSEMRAISTGYELLNVEPSQAEFTSLQLWYDHLEVSAVYSAATPAIWFSEGQPVNVTSESAFCKFSRIWIYNAYRGFFLRSQGATGGLIWQTIFEQCLTWDSLDYGFYFWSVSQVSTTTTFQNCHTKNEFRSSVQRNNKVFRALQTMPVNTPIEPEVTAGWENYWLLGKLPNGNDEVPTTQPEWTTATFYRTCGRGYFINNVQTVSLINCSADGGTNFEAGNVIRILNSHVSCDSFHLEGTNLNSADNPPIIINSDLEWGWLYLFNLRIQMPNLTDRCALFGGDMSRQRTGKISGVRNQTQNAVKRGDIDYMRLHNGTGQDFLRFEAGIGFPAELVTGKETARAFTASRNNSRTADLEFVLASTLNYYKIYEVVIPDTGASEATFQEFSDIVEVSSNSGNDDTDLLGRYAKVRISAFVQSGPGTPNKVRYDLDRVSGNADYIFQTFNTTTRLLELWVKCKANGQSSIANVKARGNSFDTHTAKQRMAYGATARTAVLVEAQAGFAEVASSAGNTAPWQEVIPPGNYSSGSFNLPSGVSWTDVTSVSVIYSERNGDYFGSSIIDVDQVSGNFSNKIIGFSGDSDSRMGGVWFNNSTSVTVTTTGSARVVSMRIRV